jgi:hypothetical protein
MHALPEAWGEIRAIESYGGQFDPVGFDFDGGLRKLYVSARSCYLLLPVAIPHGRPCDVVLFGAVDPHFLTNDQIYAMKFGGPGQNNQDLPR